MNGVLQIEQRSGLESELDDGRLGRLGGITSFSFEDFVVVVVVHDRLAGLGGSGIGNKECFLIVSA